MSNELECKTLKADRPVLVCPGENLVYSVPGSCLVERLFEREREGDIQSVAVF